MFEKRATYKYAVPDQGGFPFQDRPAVTTWKEHYLTFGIVEAWKSLVDTKCRPWDDRELDTIEGFKFFSYFLGQLCLTAEFLMCTQTLNPWMV